MKQKAIATLEESLAFRKRPGRVRSGRQAEEKKCQDRIQLAEQAVQEATASAQLRITAAEKEAAEWQAKDRPDRAKAAEDQAAVLRQQLADGTYEYFKKELGFGNTIKGWRQFIKETTESLQKTLALFAAGEMGIHVKARGHGATAKQVKELMELKRAEIVRVQKRELAFRLVTLGVALDGKGVEQHLRECLDQLLDVEQQIAEGTYEVRVAALGGVATSRNGVQGLIAEALEKQLRAAQQLHDGTYQAPGTAAGAESIGEVRARLRSLEEVRNIAELTGRGDDVRRSEEELRRLRAAEAELKLQVPGRAGGPAGGAGRPAG